MDKDGLSLPLSMKKRGKILDLVLILFENKAPSVPEGRITQVGLSSQFDVLPRFEI